jgi:hypothetical protein
MLCGQRLAARSSETVFVREEMLLSAPVTLVRQRILAQMHHDGLHAAAAAALHDGQRILHESGHTGGYQPVTVHTLAAYPRGVVTVIPIRWLTLGQLMDQKPTLDANLELNPATLTTTQLVLTGIYRPPPLSLAKPVGPSVQQRIARRTAQGFLAHIADLMPTPSPAPNGSAPAAGEPI